MKHLIEYGSITVVALALWLLPRPLNWTPKQTGFALGGATALTFWLIARSRTAIWETHQQEALDYQSERQQAEQQAAQLQQSQHVQQLYAQLQQEAAQKEAQLIQAAQQRFALIEQRYQELQQAKAEFERQRQIAAQQPTAVDRARILLAEQKEMLQIGLELAKEQATVEHHLEQHRQQLGMANPQDVQAQALLQVMQQMEQLAARLPAQSGGRQTVNVPAHAVGQSNARQSMQSVAFTEPTYDQFWGEPDQPHYDEVTID
jgi:hypothetical protein